jgi:hypothetical protein
MGVACAIKQPHATTQIAFVTTEKIVRCYAPLPPRTQASRFCCIARARFADASVFNALRDRSQELNAVVVNECDEVGVRRWKTRKETGRCDGPLLSGLLLRAHVPVSQGAAMDHPAIPILAIERLSKHA